MTHRYCAFLATFTTTQLFDAYYWYIKGPADDVPCTAANHFLSKYVLPFVVFFQPIVLGWFPSSAFPKWRTPYQVCALLGAAVLACMYGCSVVFADSMKPPHDRDQLPTILWGGAEPSLLIILVGIGFWAVGAVAFCRPLKCGTNILLVGGCVLGLLLVFDGTIRLLSKMCTYCLLLSVIWVLEPYFMPPCDAGGVSGGGPADGEDAARRQLLVGDEEAAAAVGAPLVLGTVVHI